MYTVHIYSQTTKQWRTTTETTLAACVALTLGLATRWLVRWHCQDNLEQRFGTGQPGNGCPIAITWTTQHAARKYAHARRSLLCRWSKRGKDVKTAQLRSELRWLYSRPDWELWLEVKHDYETHTKV